MSEEKQPERVLNWTKMGDSNVWQASGRAGDYTITLQESGYFVLEYDGEPVGKRASKVYQMNAAEKHEADLTTAPAVVPAVQELPVAPTLKEDGTVDDGKPVPPKKKRKEERAEILASHAAGAKKKKAEDEKSPDPTNPPAVSPPSSTTVATPPATPKTAPTLEEWKKEALNVGKPLPSANGQPATLPMSEFKKMPETINVVVKVPLGIKEGAEEQAMLLKIGDFLTVNDEDAMWKTDVVNGEVNQKTINRLKKIGYVKYNKCKDESGKVHGYYYLSEAGREAYNDIKLNLEIAGREKEDTSLTLPAVPEFDPVTLDLKGVRVRYELAVTVFGFTKKQILRWMFSEVWPVGDVVKVACLIWSGVSADEVKEAFAGFKKKKVAPPNLTGEQEKAMYAFLKKVP